MTLRALLLASACAAVACGSSPRSAPPTAIASAPVELSLGALDGGELDFASLRGQVVVIHVFTTWSLAAQAEIEQLQATDALSDVAVVGVALDPDGRVMVAPWRNANRINYLIALADERVRSGGSPLGQLSTVPTTIVLDRAGRIREYAARQLEPSELTTLIEAVRSAP